jgi:hypothetical protein
MRHKISLELFPNPFGGENEINKQMPNTLSTNNKYI